MEDDPGGPTLLWWVLYKSVSRPTLHSVDPHFGDGSYTSQPADPHFTHFCNGSYASHSVDPHFCDGSYTSQSVDPHFCNGSYTGQSVDPHFCNGSYSIQSVDPHFCHGSYTCHSLKMHELVRKTWKHPFVLKTSGKCVFIIHTFPIMGCFAIVVLAYKVLKVSYKNTPGSPFFDSFWSLSGPFFTKSLVPFWSLSGTFLFRDQTWEHWDLYYKGGTYYFFSQ